MTGEEMVLHLRESILDDIVEPVRWKTTELLRYLNYAEVQACRRSHLLIDATTTNDNGTAATAGALGQQPLCTLTLVANQAVYNLSPKVLQVKRCQLRSMSYPLEGPKTYPEMDELMDGWIGTSGTVGTAGSGGYPIYFLNEPGNTVTFILAPGQAGTASLVVSRLPLTPFTLQTSPEIPEKYHEGMMNWAAHLAYMKGDAETLNLNLAKVYEDMFIKQFGPLPDAYSERMRKVLSQRQRMRPREFGS
ncbi:MAG: hypothetical protein EHM36_05460 [Deltaproteobacteria bacterium]|nr:MAG: hypothetical protein EHM36_05460 [Deltaproteobacteria bacterium]